ncbi:MAG: hypothetical protein R3C02_12275 [Planctomycetaceae bacterium]
MADRPKPSTEQTFLRLTSALERCDKVLTPDVLDHFNDVSPQNPQTVPDGSFETCRPKQPDSSNDIQSRDHQGVGRTMVGQIDFWVAWRHGDSRVAMLMNSLKETSLTRLPA